MKLWQKISLIALVFVTLAVQLTQFYILDSHFRSAIAREVNSAASAHSALAASLSNHAAYERLKANTLFLSTDQLTDMLKDTITTDISTADVIEVKKGGKTITAVGTEVLDGASYDLASVKPNDAITDGKTVIFDAGEKTYLMVVSIIKLEAMSYELRTVYDVTNVYDKHDANLNNARMWGLCCGGGISVLLLISVLGSLRPLKRAVKTIGAAAAGDYTVRMPEKGSSELKTLAHSINEMTASINEREEKLRGIAESRKRFADAMAHEMKTPLTSILGFADILRIKSVVTDEQRRDFASAIVEEAKRLRGLSAKLLTLASTDNTPLDFADIPVAQLFSDVHATMAPVLGRHGIKLTTLHKNAVLHIDRELFLSLLYNLIDNAAKASPDNSEIWLIQSELDGHTVVSVIDRGMGMKPDTVRRATEAFYMEDKARSRKAGGAGLGLALCDDICRRHGARLEIRSTYQKGTTIIIHMNVAPIPKNQGDELEALLQKRPPREKIREKERQKRNIFLSVFLPLFLCAAILTLGYFSPTLFSRVMPNFKNKESAAQITGAESPLYLEDPSSLVLPPWNDIDDSKSQVYASDNQSVPYSIKMRITDDLQTYAESTGDSRFYTYNNQLQDPYVYIDMSDLYVRSIIEPFLKGCTINDNMQFSGYMHTYDPNDNFSTLPKYIYAQNVTVNTKEGRDFLVDFVFTPISGIPLYVHATEIDAATAAFPEDSEFFNLVVTALFVATHAEADADEFTSQVESYYTSDKYTSLIASFYDFPAHLFSFPPDTTPEEDWRVELLVGLRDNMYDMLYNFVYSIDSASSIDYRDESLIVLRNEIGYTMTVFYDAISESITGYGLDPSNPDVYHAAPFLFGETVYQGAYVYDG